MRLIIKSVIVFSIINTIFAFTFVPYPISPKAQLQVITDQIDTELLLIEKKGKHDRVLSKRLIREISHFSNSCPLEKTIINNKGTAAHYSVEKGQLLLTLLNRKLTQSTYKKIFKMVTFKNAYLVGVDLNNTNLEGVNLYKANLSQANLSRANLKTANLRKAILSRSDLSNAILTKANLVGAKFGHVILDNTDFTGANLHGADFTNDMPHLIKP